MATERSSQRGESGPTVPGAAAPAEGGRPGASRGPLSPEHLRELSEARARSKKVMRAAKVAVFGGWTTGVFSGLTLLTGFLSPSAVALGLGMAGVAYNEFRGAAMLRAFDERAARRLGFNQIGFGALLIAYGLWGAWAAMSAPGAVGSSLALQPTGDASMDAMLGDIGRLERAISAGVYLTVAAFGVIGPGITAAYYFTRARLVRRFVGATPAWAVEVLRSAA